MYSSLVGIIHCCVTKTPRTAFCQFETAYKIHDEDMFRFVVDCCLYNLCRHLMPRMWFSGPLCHCPLSCHCSFLPLLASRQEVSSASHHRRHASIKSRLASQNDKDSDGTRSTWVQRTRLTLMPIFVKPQQVATADINSTNRSPVANVDFSYIALKQRDVSSSHAMDARGALQRS